MIRVYFIKREELEFINVSYGMIIYCIDTKECYFVNNDDIKINITDRTVVLQYESELEKIISPVLSKIYIIRETEKVYGYLNKWELIENPEVVYNIAMSSHNYSPKVLTHNGDLILPVTTDNSVFMNDGTLLSDNLSNIILTKTRTIYVGAEIDNQRVFYIPYPTSHFNFIKDSMCVIRRNNILSSTDFVINNDKLILNSDMTINYGESLLFIFYYTTEVDLNLGFIVKPENIEDKSIGTEKLDPSIRLSADSVNETHYRLFLTPEERVKLENIEEGASHYMHPETHPAEMIVESEDRMFISSEKLNSIDNKANSDSVFTKEEVIEMVERVYNTILDNPSATLDTLKEISEALGNDPNFSTTILNKLSEKANITDLEPIRSNIDSKVNITDYVRSGIYATARRTVYMNRDLYMFNFSDNNFREYIDGMLVILKITSNNTTKCMLQINELEPKPILTTDDTTLVANELKKDVIYTLRYNGTTGNFILQGKGGVTLLNLKQEQYIVDDDEIVRGSIVDIIEGKVRNSKSRLKLQSIHEGKDDVYNCDTNLKVLSIDSKNFVNIWQNNNLLRIRLFTINNNYITNDIIEQPIILDVNCSKFNAIKIGTYIVVCVITTENKMNLMLLRVSGTQIEVLNTRLVNEPEVYSVKYFHTIDIKDNKFILAYETDDKNVMNYYNISDNSINEISLANNTNYPMEYCLKISDAQVLFLGQIDGDFHGWVLNVYDNATLYTTLEYIDAIQRYNLLLTLNDNQLVNIQYTNEQNTQLFTKEIIISTLGDISTLPTNIITSDVEEIQEITYSTRIRFDENNYIAVTNYDRNSDIDLDNDNRSLIKFVCQDTAYRNNDTSSIIDKKYTLFSIDKLNSETFIFCYTLNNKINTCIYKLKKYPDGIAKTNGIIGETITVEKW